MLAKRIMLMTAIAVTILIANVALVAAKDDDRSYLPPPGGQSQAKAPAEQIQQRKGHRVRKVRLRTAHRHHRHARRYYASRNGAVRVVHFRPHRHRDARRYYASWHRGFFLPGIFFGLFR